jgi:arginine N-succinyltransferase
MPFQILTDEGFEPDEYIDIFDGGPILQAHKNALSSFSRSMVRTVAAKTNNDAEVDTFLIATAREDRFRAIVSVCTVSELSDLAVLDEEAMRLLDVTAGDSVVCVKL